MRKLHIQFYLAILATLAVFVLMSAVFWRLTDNSRDEALGSGVVAQLAAGLLPPVSASPTEQQRSIDDLHRRLGMGFAVYDRDGRVLAATANVPRLSPRRLARSGWTLARGGPLWVIALEDGRHLVVQHPHPPAATHWHLLIVPIAIILAFALGAYPIARRLSGRLARLQTGVEHLGQGDLTTRVAVEGRDEVAALARSFNQSAERIEELVKAHKLLLANCSHELRTPLARVRLGIERLVSAPSPSIHDELTRSIAELDGLIEEMLLASRLDANKALEHVEDVDVLALAAEEAAQFDRTVEGQSLTVRGDPALLRRMIRNLLDNAGKHGGGATRIEVSADADGAAQIIIDDNGPGVAEPDRARIFEPFYRAAGARSELRGVGLGLAIVRQIARAHGGEISYVPLPGAGSRFVVRLSINERSPSPSDQR